VRRRSYSATGKPQQPVGQRPPGGEHDALGGALQQVLLHRPQPGGRHEDDDEQADGGQQLPAGADRLDDPGDQRRLGQRAGGRDQGEDGGHGQRTPVRPQEG
jgi:hypothetical protein